ncbi:2-hydroxychromene-2-carboxylate isomerase [Hoeflea sp. AS60]|uniref:2-hydroxychromene-2-carboxylate isomerase n=1 Tax=Hoeflea sp. AS60 TaxID=3135780 RepID=UPI003181F5C1
MTLRTIEFHYDLISPFAHVALARLGELPADISVRPVPVLLGAVLRHWGQLGPAEISAKRLHTYRQSVFAGKQYGVDVRFPPRHPFNSLKAMRLMAGAEPDLATVQRAFDFVFRDGRAPDTDEELAAFAEAVGIPVDLASDDSAKATLRTNTEQAIARGVFGVPSFVCTSGSGHEVFWGVDSLDMMLAWLGDETLFDNDPYRHLDDVSIGIERK